MPTNHPYVEFENTKLWNAVAIAISNLEKNNDLKLETAREYIIGYLCKELAGKSVATTATKRRGSAAKERKK